jgi:hypothetical protein
VEQWNVSSLQRQWLISLPHSLIFIHPALGTLTNLQVVIIEEIFWLLKLCQLAHYCSHNSGKTQTGTTSWSRGLTILRQLLPLLFQVCHSSGCQEKGFFIIASKLKLKGTRK